MPIFIAFSVMVKVWKQSRLFTKWMDQENIVYRYTQWSTAQLHQKNKILPFVITWVNVEDN